VNRVARALITEKAWRPAATHSPASERKERNAQRWFSVVCSLAARLLFTAKERTEWENHWAAVALWFAFHNFLPRSQIASRHTCDGSQDCGPRLERARIAGGGVTANVIISAYAHSNTGFVACGSSRSAHPILGDCPASQKILFSLNCLARPATRSTDMITR
jgi:hypothetical protein